MTTYPVRGAEASRDAFAVCTGYVVLPSAGYRVLFFLLLLVSVDVYPCSHRHILVQPLDVLVAQTHAPVRHGGADRFRVWRAVQQVAVAEVEPEVTELALNAAGRPALWGNEPGVVRIDRR